jgi:hypothetical protein
MTYTELLRQLYFAGYTRVERDDRLLDVFPKEDREKGVELWEKWGKKDVELLRVRLPFDAEKLKLYTIPRPKLEKLLQQNIVAELSVFLCIAEGEAVARTL